MDVCLQFQGELAVWVRGREQSSQCPSSLGTGRSFEQAPVEVKRSKVRFWTLVSEGSADKRCQWIAWIDYERHE